MKYLFVLQMIWISVLASAQTSQSSQEFLDVNKLQTDINASGLGWVAGSNHLTEKPLSTLRKMLLPMNPLLAIHQVSAQRAQSTSVNPPAAAPGTEIFDWRNYKGANWIGPVQDQGSYPSCLVFADLAAVESQITIASGLSWLRPQLSVQAMFSCSTDFQNSWGSRVNKDVTDPFYSVRYLVQNGVPDAACAPYILTNGAINACNTICPDAAQRTIRPTTFNEDLGVDYVDDPGSMDRIKVALKRGPIAVTMTAYDDFLAYKSGIYKATRQGVSGQHAVLLIGYNEPEQYWIVRNSWGTDWGENGFARISYADENANIEISFARDAAQFYVSNQPTDEIVAFKNLLNGAFVHGDLKIDGFSNMKTVDTLQLVVLQPDGTKKNITCNSRQECHLRSVEFADGQYEVYLQALSNQKSVGTSEHKYFFIANHAPTNVVLSLENVDGLPLDNSSVDLNVGLRVKLSSASIPLNRYTAFLRKDGRVVKTWQAMDIPLLPLVKSFDQQWRTLDMPNGNYTLQLEAGTDVGSSAYLFRSPIYQVTIANPTN